MARPAGAEGTAALAPSRIRNPTVSPASPGPPTLPVTLAEAPRVELALRDDVERGALLTNDRVFVQTADGSLFLHHRADGRRTSLSVPRDASGKPPQVVWAQGLADGRVAAYDHR